MSGARGQVTNIHLRLAPNPALVKAHAKLLDLMVRQFSWFTPGPFAGAAFVPHISIFDRISLDPTEAKRIIDNAAWQDVPFTLSDPHIRAVPHR
jgi:hypothetical protein